jgi:hypothetical protein
MEAMVASGHDGEMHIRHTFLLASFLSACAAAHPPCGDVPDAASGDGGPPPCPAPLVDEGDACVGWRAIPPPPCEPTTLVLCGAEVAVTCELPLTYALDPSFVWTQTDASDVLVEEEHDGPEGFAIEPRLVVTLDDGTRVATHGDVYATPAAWRTDASGRWRETVPPPSAFLTHATALSEHEALFVGQDAYVFTVRRR